MADKIKRTYQLKDYQDKALKILSKETRVKEIAFIREAIDDLILKYQKQLPKYLAKSIVKVK